MPPKRSSFGRLLKTPERLSVLDLRVVRRPIDLTMRRPSVAGQNDVSDLATLSPVFSESSQGDEDYVPDSTEEKEEEEEAEADREAEEEAEEEEEVDSYLDPNETKNFLCHDNAETVSSVDTVKEKRKMRASSPVIGLLS